MAKPSLVFRAIHLLGMPGFGARERFDLGDLGPGVTIIHGPNEIGKSTLARAMKFLLWRDLPAGRSVDLEAVLDVGGVLQTRRRIQDQLTALGPDGREVANPSPWLGKDLERRYCIGIRDLLQQEQPGEDPHADFAKVIRTQTQGVDLDLLWSRVEALDQLPFRVNNESRAVQAACEEVARLRGLQEANRHLEEELEADEEALKGRQELDGRRQDLGERLRALDLAEELLALEAPLAPFQGEEARLAVLPPHGGEAFGHLVQARAQARKQREKLEAELRTCREDLLALSLGAPVLERDRLEADGLARDLASAGTRLDEATGEAAGACAASDAWMASSAWLEGQGGTLPTVDQAMLVGAGRIAAQLEDARAARAAWTQVAGNLRTQADAVAAVSRAGELRLLMAWLAADARVQARADALDGLARTPALPRSAARLLAGTLVLLAGLAAAQAAATHGPARFGLPGLALLAGASLAWAWRLLRQAHAAAVPDRDGAEVVRRKLEEELAGLGHAGAWTEARVKALMEDLRGNELAFQGVASLRQRQADAEAQAGREAGTLRDLLREQAGLIPGLDAGLALLDHRGYLQLVVAQVRTLQEHRAAVATAGTALDLAAKAKADVERRTDLFLARCARPGGEPRAAALEALDRDLGRALDLQAAQTALEARLPEATMERDQAEDRLRAFLADLGGLSEPAFTALWAQREAWAAPHRAYHDQLRSLQVTPFRSPAVPDLLAPILERGAAPPEVRKRLLAGNRARLEADLGAVLDALSRLDRIHQELPEKKATLRSFLTQGAVAAAMRSQEAKGAVLEAQRLKLLEGRALGLILARQKQLVEERDRPEVIQRASDHFHTFTNRYDLTCADGRFLAQEGPVQLPLSALSDGTRVQLLLAVRLAFMEQDEDVQLPLFLDEVLGIADDPRADAIVRAVLKIAETGRQVFYFTAQQDELARWRHLGGAALNPAVNLAAVRNRAVAEAYPVPATGWEPPAVPEPAGRPMPEYVRALSGAAGPSVWTALEAQHVHHALGLGDEELLAGLLRRRVETLGNLKRMVGEDPAEPWPSIAATLQVLEAAQTLLRRNRAKVVDADVIAGLDLPHFGAGRKTAFREYLQGLGWDLAAAFREGLPGKFAAVEAGLKDWFEANGYLIPAALTAEELMLDLVGRHRHLLPPEAPRWQVIRRYVEGATA